ncbi:hypothetical protein [Nannocystis bainbridge]|uniref:Uncharacterized protein n=1 Tax=Nannocystis bainbridge TaxID=2995303 RepID=A0ABT5E295_9BACT|nr:hypothetical protein [Nannocystis bainbridge]MDC0719999.1 hypothetical protein [Nannocystis bainbridge]
MTRKLALLGVLVSGCGGAAATTDDATSASSTATGSTSSTSTANTPTSASTTEDSTAPTAGDSMNFAVGLDLPQPGVACDPWQDDCPAGLKCKPYAEGLGPWTDASCVPIADPSTPTGEACLEAEWSVVDTCERGAVCHGYLGDQEEGRRCQEVCAGSPADPSCSDACSFCTMNGTVAGVCMLRCDPRSPSCPAGQRCLIEPTLPRFACGPGGELSAAGEPCVSPDYCKEGTACVDAALVPGCVEAQCCAPVCDLAGADACPTALPGTTCAPWPVSGPEFEGECLPPDLGLCSAM